MCYMVNTCRSSFRQGDKGRHRCAKKKEGVGVLRSGWLDMSKRPKIDTTVVAAAAVAAAATAAVVVAAAAAAVVVV